MTAVNMKMNNIDRYTGGELRYRVSVVSHIGKIRAVNQDNFYCSGHYRSLEEIISEFDSEETDEKTCLAALFDGMGGERDGEIASLLAGRIISDCAEAGFNIDIENLIMSINTQICREMSKRKCRMGSTCVFMEFDNEKCRSWNVGDSRAYHYHDGALKQMSEDHTEASSFGELFKGETAARPGSENRLTQYLGIPEDDFIIEPFVSPWERFETGDILMLCSDGLTHMTGDEEICDILRTDITLREKKERLLDAALISGGTDNITIILIETC